MNARQICDKFPGPVTGLTVTKVVFEFNRLQSLELLIKGLTVTKVVFELIGIITI